MIRPRNCRGDSGSALLLALLVLTLLSILGLFMFFGATAGVQISDNYESQVQSTYAALAGIRHARVLFRGLDLNQILRGPDGVYDTTASYLTWARGFEFRNPVSLPAALRLDIDDPSSVLAGIPDDGVISTGFYNGSPGIPLIPGAGTAQIAPNSHGAGMMIISRYFVKVGDNNGDASEMAGDAANNPFVDGDGIVIVRSLGIARTIPDIAGSVLRRNSVALFEARFKRRSAFELGPALVVLGPQAGAEFGGAIEISGGSNAAIGTIDTASGDLVFPERTMRAAAGACGGITGGGEPSPSIRDITAQVLSDPDRRLLLSPAYWGEFIQSQARGMADNFYEGSQSWMEGDAPVLGTFDASKPWNAPGQDPKITVVQGDLQISGMLSGAGLLVVTGNLSYSGAFAFKGLVIVAGSGGLAAEGSGPGIEGGVLVAKLTGAGSETAFGSPGISIGGNSRIISDGANVRMAVSLIPVSQISFREVAGSDP